MIKIGICGACGKMGANIIELLDEDCEAVAIWGVDPSGNDAKVRLFKAFDEIDETPDAVIDFSSPAALDGELEYCLAHGVPLVIGSTGFTPDQLKKIEKAAQKIAIFRTANFSLGINLLYELVKRAAAFLGADFDVEIVEKHHRLKKDAPSGTALMLAESVNAAFDGERKYIYGREGICGERGNEIGLHAVRGGTVVGEHEVTFLGNDEAVTLSHSATSKKVFAAGAIKAAKFVVGKPAGTYKMSDVLGN